MEYFSTYRKTATDGLWQLLLRRRSQNSPPPPTFPAAAPAVGREGGWHTSPGPRFTHPPLPPGPTPAKNRGQPKTWATTWSAEGAGASLRCLWPQPPSSAGGEGHPIEVRWERKEPGTHDPKHMPTHAQSQTSQSYTSTVHTTSTIPPMPT